jgi:choline dehydrogenase
MASEIDNGNLTMVPGTDVFFAGKDPTDTNNLIDWNFVTQPQAVRAASASGVARGPEMADFLPRV